jgi:hypothetical protein
MGRDLAALPHSDIQLRIFDNAMHNDIIDYALADIVRFLRGGEL